MKPPQALTTTYATRIATFSTALITPAGLNPASGAPGATPVGERSSGRTKRGTTVVNYAEVDGDDDLEVDNESNVGQRGSNTLIVGGGPPQNGLGTNIMGNIVETIKRPVQVPGRPAQPRSSQGLYRYIQNRSPTPLTCANHCFFFFPQGPSINYWLPLIYRRY